MKNILLILFVLFISCGKSSEENQEQEATIDSLKNEIEELKEANDTLSEHLMTRAYATRNYPAYFDTIPEPETHILEQLQQNTDLIPKEAVLGGTMRFIKVDFINNELLVAQYEDGHVMGKAVYTYSMDRRGNLQFQLVGTVE